MTGSGWRCIPLGDFVTLRRGYDLPDAVRRPGNTPILGSFGVTGWHDESRAAGPGVTVGRSGASFGVVNYSPVDYWPLNTALYVTDFHGNDQRFAYYFLKQFDFQSYNSGSAQPSLNRNFIHPIPVDVPPVCEQRAIAHVLGTLDDKIELNRRMNQTLEELARALFKSWFVDFAPVHAKAALKHHSPLSQGGSDWTVERARAYLDRMDSEIAALFPDSFADSELGRIPEGWEVKALPEAIDFKEGPGIRNWQYTNSEEGIRFINIRCIQNGDLVLSTANRIEDEEAKGKYSHFHLREWDVVVSTSGTLGRSAIVRREHLPLVLNTSVIRFRPVQGKTLFGYVHGYLNSPMFLDELESMASGSVQKNFGPMHLKKMRVLCPSFICIKQFEDIAGSFLRKLIENRAGNDVLANFRNSLLPKLISGEIRVRYADVRRLMGCI